MRSIMDVKITTILVLFATLISITSAGKQHVALTAIHSDLVDEQQLADNDDDVTAIRRSRRATPVTKTSLTQDDRAQFIISHNSKRRLVQAANNMAEVVWNSGLESMAQEWASQCNWKHGQPSRTKTPFSNIGQNLYATSSSTYSIQNAVQSWYDEISYYTYDTMACLPNKVCGHYTQLVWATSYAIGCGIASCNQINGVSFGGYLVVCNYGPAGNWVGQQPYTTGGVQCSACPSNMPSCDAGLCTTTTACSLITECTPTNTTYCLCDESYYQSQLAPSSAATLPPSVQISAMLAASVCLFCALSPYVF